MADETQPDWNTEDTQASFGPAAFTTGNVVLGRYIIKGQLGRGAMGIVYHCHDEISGVDLALKTIPFEVAVDQNEMLKVRDNFQLVHKLHHPHIANLNNLERDPETGQYYLLMEYVSGEDLAQYSRRWTPHPPLSFWLPILKQVASGLTYAHKQQIIHRDIKPSNIFIKEDGTAKLLDFGIASQIRTSMSHVTQQRNQISGTATYMPPEQWLGQPTTPESDQYAFAVTLHKLLTGRCPFENPSTVALRESVLNDPPVRPKEISPSAWKVISKALSKQAKNRYTTCEDIVHDLEHCEKGSSTKAPRSLKAFTALLLCGLLGFGAWKLLPSLKQKKISAPTVTATDPLPEPTVVTPGPTAEPEINLHLDEAKAKAQARMNADAQRTLSPHAQEMWNLGMARYTAGEAALSAEAFGDAEKQFIQADHLLEKALLQAKADQEKIAKLAAKKEKQQKIQHAERRQQIEVSLHKVETELDQYAAIQKSTPDVWALITNDLTASRNALEQGILPDAEALMTRAKERLTTAAFATLLEKAPKESQSEVTTAPAFAQATLILELPPDLEHSPQMEVIHNGHSLGIQSFPFTLSDLPPGRHSFQLTGNNQLEAVDIYRIELKAGQRLEETMQLRLKPAFVEFQLIPKNTTVTLDDHRNIRRIKETSFRAQPGKKYTFTFTAKGHHSEKRTVSLEPGETHTITVHLKKRKRIGPRP